MEPWLKEYPPGVPAEVDVTRYRSLIEVFEHSVGRYAKNPAYENFGTILKFSDVERLSRAFAGFLQQSGLRKGERIALMLPNVLAYPVALFGALRAGLVVVNVNPLYTPRELKHVLDDSGARAIVVLENFAHVLQAVGESTVELAVVTAIGDFQPGWKRGLMNFVVRHVRKQVSRFRLERFMTLGEALSRGSRTGFQSVEVSCEDLAFLQYTGGTTGICKGAMLTHGNMVANLVQVCAWFQGHLRAGEEVIVTALPLYHIFALLANALLFLVLGGCNLLITNPRDLKGFVRTLQSAHFTCITGVNTLFNALLNTHGFERCDFSQLHLTLGGGMAVQHAVAERWKRMTGNVITEAYGLTETSPAACINPWSRTEHSGCIGLPISSTECMICNEEGKPLPAGVVGEICIRGPQVMRGYWYQPDETARVLSSDGWLRTGDLGFMDERGYFRIVDRKKDMILVSGFNVYPNELEDVAVAHPGVLEAAAIGIPDAKTGEAPLLYVVKKDPLLTEAVLLDHLRTQLTHYKLPRAIEFRTHLPKTNVGKVLRRVLRDEWRAATEKDTKLAECKGGLPRAPGAPV